MRALFLVTLLGCGAQGSVPVADAHALPATDADPPPYTPPPAPSARSGGSAALAITGSHQQARDAVVRLMRAMRDRDEATLNAMFVENVQRFPSRARAISRSDLVRTLLNPPANVSLPTAGAITEIVNVEGMTVEPLRERYSVGPLPNGLDEADLLVEVEVLPASRNFFRQTLGFTGQIGFVLRPAYDVRVVALGSAPRVINVN